MMLRGGAVVFLWAALLSAQVVPDQYIVELASPPALAAAPSAKGVQQARVDVLARVRAEQARVQSEVEAHNGRVLGRVERVANALIVSLPSSDAAALAANPSVRRVYPVVKYHATLDRAAAIHSFKPAWEVVGGIQNAGLGAKIGILDTGIDQTHPAFNDPTLQVPDGYPKTGDGDAEFTNNKIIVARHYAESNAGDGNGHGTAVAMAAAGLPVAVPPDEIVIAGAAPKAFLGSYKVLDNSGSGDSGTTLRALDDAVADGMDVVNLSFGSPVAQRPGDDPIARAVERAVASGVIVVVSAGNDGSDPNTIGSPGTADSAITVGALRTGVGTATLDGLPPISGYMPVEATSPKDSISGPMFDVERLDATGLACQPLDADSLTGKVALIFRGECNFEVKLNNAQAAGAVAAVIYSQFGNALPIRWISGAATLPAIIVTNAAGLRMKQQLADFPDASAVIAFPRDMLSGFSSRGPNSDLAIKPDLIALGQDVLTAAETGDSTGELYSPSGFVGLSGTSFSSPIVAGAAAVVKAGRPGLTPNDYRSLVINSAAPFSTGDPRQRVQQTGAGMLDLAAAMRNTVTAFPAALGFGAGGGTAELTRDIELANVGTATESYDISVDAVNGPVPSVSAGTIQLAPGERQKVTFTWSGADLGAGEYQGFVEIRGSGSGSRTRVPYWYAVAGGAPSFLTVLQAPTSSSAGGTATVLFRVSDPVGLPLPGLTPEVSVVAGGGEVIGVTDLDEAVPGLYRARLLMGPEAGANVFEIKTADLPPVTIRLTTSADVPTGHP